VQTKSGQLSQEGTGLGLPISRQFVQLMGGDITVSSTLGERTTFKFDIKVTLAKADEVQTAAPTRRILFLAPDQPTYRILAVDDRWESRQLLLHLLSPLGFEVREAENGQQAVVLWDSWQPHLILMDMQMPVMNGYEATKQIKSHLKGQATVIIALTASAFEEQRTMILSAGYACTLSDRFSSRSTESVEGKLLLGGIENLLFGRLCITYWTLSRRSSRCFLVFGFLAHNGRQIDDRTAVREVKPFSLNFTGTQALSGSC
jgi:CheY-like chemotaxis protein